MIKNYKLYMPPFILACLSFILIFYKLGDGSLSDWDEAIYANVVRETLLSGKGFLTLYLHEAPWFHKPPLIFWMLGSLYNLFGVSEFMTRIPSALCGVGGVFVTYLFARRLFNSRVATLASIFLLLTPHYFMYARSAMIDVPLTLFILLALFYFWRGESKSLNFIVSGIFVGIAIMTKGMAGLLAPIIILMYLALSHRMHLIRNRHFLMGIGVALVVSVPWHIYQYILFGTDFLNEYFGYHVLTRFLTAIEGHTGGWTYYLRALVKFGFPVGILGVFSVIFFIFKEKALLRSKPQYLFLFSWIVVILGVFTIAQTNDHNYIIPIYPALCIASAYFLYRVAAHNFYKVIPLLIVGVVLINTTFYKESYHQDPSREVRQMAPQIKRIVPSGTKIITYSPFYSWSVEFYAERRVACVCGDLKKIKKFHMTKEDYDKLKRLIREEKVRYFLLTKEVMNALNSESLVLYEPIVQTSNLVFLRSSGINNI